MGQLTVLYNDMQAREVERMKFQARLMGLDIKDEPTVSSGKPITGPDRLIFGGPDMYAGMSQEEKEVLTKEMKAHYKNWSSTSVLKKG
jgi:hypothetical protein